jgi:hypothetical protein
VIKKLGFRFARLLLKAHFFRLANGFFFPGAGRFFFLSSHYAGSILTWWTLKHYAGLDLDVVNPKPAGAGSKHYSGLRLLGSFFGCIF